LENDFVRSPNDCCQLENGICHLPDDDVLLIYDHVRLPDDICYSTYRVGNPPDGLELLTFDHRKLVYDRCKSPNSPKTSLFRNFRSGNRKIQ